MKARNLAEDQEEIFILIALEYQNMKKSAEAVKYFRKALKINPNNDFALYEIAWSYDEAGQTAEAIRFFEEFIDVYPYSLTAWQNLGLARIRSGEFEEAIQAFDYALAIEDDFVPAIVYKAYSLAGLLRYDEAIEVYKSSFEIQEPDAETLYLIGECFEKMQNMAQAERYFRKAVAKDPDFSRAWIGLGVVAEHYERPLEGIHCIKKALDVEDKNPEYWYFLAGFQDEAGLGEEADLSYRQSLMLEPNLWESRLDYSDFLAQHGHLQEAMDLLAEGIQIDPGRTSLIYRYGALLLQAGRRKSGIEVLEQALAQDYDLHSELLEYEPLLEIDPELNRLIDRYRP
jgi:tetratricopeptide (TPR) repeat protein